MDLYEKLMLLLIIMIFLLSEIGAYHAWKHLKLLKDLERTHANFLYAIHLLSYLIIAGYIRNYSYFTTVIDGSDASYVGQGAFYLIFVTNMASVFYLQQDLYKYFNFDGKKHIKRIKPQS